MIKKFELRDNTFIECNVIAEALNVYIIQINNVYYLLSKQSIKPSDADLSL